MIFSEKSYSNRQNRHESVGSTLSCQCDSGGRLTLVAVYNFHVALGGSDAFVRHVALDGTDVSTGCGLKGRVCPAV